MPVTEILRHVPPVCSSIFLAGVMDGGGPQGVWLASAPRRSELPPAPARVQGRLRELQALCSAGAHCEVLLFVPGLPP